MGGRGRSSGLGSHQITMHDVIKQREIAEIILESAKRREGLAGSGVVSDDSTPKLFKKCACCGKYTIQFSSENEVCPVCGWIDDEYQNHHPDSLDGKNPVSLSEAKTTYQRSRIKSRGNTNN